MKIKADELSSEISKILTEYEDTTLDKMKDAVDKATKEAVTDLKNESPKLSGAYAKSWASKADKQKNNWAYAKVVYNKKYYRLTHLLEKGHRVVGAKNGRTWVNARQHISKAEQKAVQTLIEEIKK